jgi:ankyrin repeat protein
MQEIYAAGQVDPYALEKTSRRSALHKAAFWGHILTINFLIKDVRMDVNQQDFNGDTAMHDAARFGHVNVVEALLNAGGNPAIKNKKGESVIELALKQDKFDVAQCILKSQVSKM